MNYSKTGVFRSKHTKNSETHLVYVKCGKVTNCLQQKQFFSLFTAFLLSDTFECVSQKVINVSNAHLLD